MSADRGGARDSALAFAFPFRESAGAERHPVRSSPDLTIVRAADSGLDAGRIFPLRDAHCFYGGFARRYFPLVYGAARRDESFIVFERGEPKCFVCCSAGDHIVDYYGQPASLFASGVSERITDVVAAAAIDRLQALAVGKETLWVSDFLANDMRSAVCAACSGRGFAPSPKFSGLCDLSLEKDSLRRALRKSYRSLVNWGKKNMRVAYVNDANPDRTGFQSYREFHLRVAGRVTRSQCTWDAMYAWITGGKGELSLGYLDTGELVAGTMVVDGETTAYYSSGVYDRERFDLPIAHWLVHDAVLRSRERGLRWFDLGDVPEKGTVGDKEYSIGFFKSGFATEIRPWTNWVYRAVS